MGTEQYLLQKERKEGFQEGIEKGVEKGVWKKTEEVVLSLFGKGFKLETISDVAQINTDQVLEILRSHSRI